MRKILLRSRLSLGDIVVLTAAVRDLHRCYPNQFLTSVDTTCSEVWEYNPWISPLDPRSPDVETVSCEYPLIQWSNQVPYHFLHGFIDDLNAQLKLEIRATQFSGDIYLSKSEKQRPSPVEEVCQGSVPYWLILAGGKHDVTIKWWDSKRYQEVVNAFRGRIQFVQLGQAGHFHPKLDGVIDLRGRTSLRDLIRLVYRAQGVLCGVTGLMHLAASVPAPPESPGLRPCVVVAGGREPVHWEAYPGHEFIHTVGQLPCCAAGGCWRSRTSRLGDGDPRDRSDQLCLDVRAGLPHCMHLIETEEVIHRVERYFDGGRCRFLNRAQRQRAHRGIAVTRENPIELQPLTPGNVRPWLERLLDLPVTQKRKRGKRGILICVDGFQAWVDAWIAVRSLRHVDCQLPIELWHLGTHECVRGLEEKWKQYDVKVLNARTHPKAAQMRSLAHRELTSFAMSESSFEELLVLAPNTVATRNPEFLFGSIGFREQGVVCWMDRNGGTLDQRLMRCLGISGSQPSRISDRELLVNRSKCIKVLRMAFWLDQYSDFFSRFTSSPADGFLASLLRCQQGYRLLGRAKSCHPHACDEGGQVVFEHRESPPWNLFFDNPALPGFSFQIECLRWLQEYRSRGMGTALSQTQRRARQNVQSLCLKTPVSPPFCRAELSNRTSSRMRPRSPRGRNVPPLSIVMLYDASMAAVGRRAEAAWAEYASEWGYGFECFREALDTARHPSWSKVLAVQTVLKEKGRMVFWVDADSLPMNYRVPVHQRMPKGFDIAFASDANGLNCGQFLSRPTPWAIRFWESVYFLSDVRKDPDGFGEKWEQNTIKAILKEFRGFEKHVCSLPERVLNASIGSFRPGDFALHFAVMSNRERLRRMQEAQRLVIR